MSKDYGLQFASGDEYEVLVLVLTEAVNRKDESGEFEHTADERDLIGAMLARLVYDTHKPKS